MLPKSTGLIGLMIRCVCVGTCRGPSRMGALVQGLELPAWKVEDREFEHHSGLHVSKKQDVSSPRIREDSILEEPR